MHDLTAAPMKLFLILFTCSLLSFANRALDEQTIIKHLQEVCRDSSYAHYPAAGYLGNEATAVQVAEPILFNIYGKDHILEQKPYQVHQIDSVWVINGTLPVNYTNGGTFFIVLNKKDGKVLSISHGK